MNLDGCLSRLTPACSGRRPAAAEAGNPDHVEVEVRLCEPEDAESVSQLIATTMRRSNVRDYPLTRLEPLIAYFTPPGFASSRGSMRLLADVALQLTSGL